MVIFHSFLYVYQRVYIVVLVPGCDVSIFFNRLELGHCPGGKADRTSESFCRAVSTVCGAVLFYGYILWLLVVNSGEWMVNNG